MLGLSPVPPRANHIVIPQDRPVYKVTDEKGFFGEDDCLYPMGSIICWSGPLNPNLEPLNELAYQNLKEYLEVLDAEGRKVAEKNGTAYRGLTGALESARKLEEMESKRLQPLGVEKQVPLMGAKRKPGRPKVERLDNSSQEAPLLGVGKHSLGSGHPEPQFKS
jgi:hypothetical protein